MLPEPAEQFREKIVVILACQLESKSLFNAVVGLTMVASDAEENFTLSNGEKAPPKINIYTEIAD